MSGSCDAVFAEWRSGALTMEIAQLMVIVLADRVV
jgi:hypothetical protein